MARRRRAGNKIRVMGIPFRVGRVRIRQRGYGEAPEEAVPPQGSSQEEEQTNEVGLEIERISLCSRADLEGSPEISPRE